MTAESVHDNSNTFIWSQRRESCRICLQNMNQQSGNNNCQCRGDLAFIHQKCHLEWANHIQHKTDKFAKKYILCDVCKQPLSLEIRNTYKCYKKDEMMKRMRQQSLQVVLLGIFALVLLGSIGVEISYMVWNNVFLIIFSLIILITIILEATVLYIFGSKYLLYKQSRVTKISSYRSKTNNKIANQNVTQMTIS